MSTGFLVLVQKLQDTCNKSINLGHTDTITLEMVRDWYGKGKCIQMEALLAGYYFVNGTTSVFVIWWR
ncbi:hypothetical protein COJ48_24695 [Bacillus cereus]|nr:hypothetical protein CN285_21525 [Bacillus cereus]PFM59842.1 hypothetical protein COJ48_24695 [Bacillus cereus]